MMRIMHNHYKTGHHDPGFGACIMISIYTLLSIADINVSRTTNIKGTSAVVNSLSLVQPIYSGHVQAKACKGMGMQSGY